MKNRSICKHIPWLILGMGAAGAVLRWQLYALALDEKNLLQPNHPVQWLLWILSVAAAVVMAAAAWKYKADPDGEAAAGGSVGPFVLAAAVALTVLLNRDLQTPTEKAAYVLGLISAAALAAVGIFRILRKQPLFALHGVVCMYFAVHMISRYPAWSSNPQIGDSVFSLLGCVFLALFAYYRSAFDANCGKARMWLATGLAAVYACAVALAHGEYPALYLGGCIWALSELLCGLRADSGAQMLADEESRE